MEKTQKHPVLYIVVYDEETKTAPNTLKAVEKTTPFYEKIEILTVHEANAKKIDLMKPNVLMENWLLKKCLEGKLKQKGMKNKLLEKAKLRVVSKGKVSARRKRNKNKKTHR